MYIVVVSTQKKSCHKWFFGLECWLFLMGVRCLALGLTTKDGTVNYNVSAHLIEILLDGQGCQA